jgi:hypothetical protein
MKIKHVLFILLVGMTSLTAMATTAKPEQNQKAEFLKDFTIQLETVSVEMSYQAAIFNDLAINQESNILISTNLTNHSIFYLIIKDSAWLITNERFIQILHKEKMIENNNLHLTKRTVKNNIPFREK